MAYDTEDAARRICKMAGVTADRPTPLRQIAAKVLGKKNVRIVPGFGSEGALIPIRGQLTLFARAGQTHERREHVFGHELGHWICHHDGHAGPDLERDCDRIGAALIAPRSAFRVAMAWSGCSFPQLAKAFRTTESLAALRYGETTGQRLALVSPDRVRVIGDRWPAEAEIRRIAEQGGPGLRRTALHDDPRRVVLR